MLGILLVWLASGSVEFDENSGGLASRGGIRFQLFPGSLAAICIFCGAVGKSAQFPLHVWLPDAMEGPTPVSALIHAATMVAAGVYMLCRVFFLVAASPMAQEVIAWIGITTAVLAALMATQQNDIKRILAYSTLSQLGYMVMAVGLKSPDAAMFHLFTHAFFKALLFLGSGAVIYAVHHEQDIWEMGGLRQKMPVTFYTFLAATLALTGCPGLSGFFSKGDNLSARLGEQNDRAIVLARSRRRFPDCVLACSRLFTVIFLGTRHKSDHASHAHEVPRVMSIPLVILGVFSVIAKVGIVFLPGIFSSCRMRRTPPPWSPASRFLWSSRHWAQLSAFVPLSKDKKQGKPHQLLANKFYIDEFYAFLIAWTQDLLACYVSWFDRWVLDWGIVRWVFGRAALMGVGMVLRFLQIGNLQAYAFIFGAGAVALIYFILFK